ncbi:MAG TPA: NUDIX hydrolase [Steroidobacteraceae bacterium]
MPLVAKRTVFEGRMITVNVERVELPNGVTSDLEIIRHPGGAAIIAVNVAGEVCLLRQFRHAVDGWLLELPAGKRDDGEQPLLTAQRELLEETGLSAERWTPLGEYVSSPGVLTEIVHLFLATRLVMGEACPEAGEVFETQWLPLEQALALALAGDITDGKTVVGLARAAERIKSK